MTVRAQLKTENGAFPVKYQQTRDPKPLQKASRMWREGPPSLLCPLHSWWGLPFIWGNKTSIFHFQNNFSATSPNASHRNNLEWGSCLNWGILKALKPLVSGRCRDKGGHSINSHRGRLAFAPAASWNRRDAIVLYSSAEWHGDHVCSPFLSEVAGKLFKNLLSLNCLSLKEKNPRDLLQVAFTEDLQQARPGTGNLPH